MKRKLFNGIIYISVVIFSTIIIAIIGSILSSTFVNRMPFWHSIQNIPEGKITKMLSIRMIPMGHIDNVFVENDNGDIYLWERQPDLITFGKENWKKIEAPKNLIINKLRAFSNYPNYGVYIQTTDGQVFMYADDQNWQKVSNNILPEERNFNCNSWPKVAEPFGRKVDKKDICMVGSMSEEARSYRLLDSGKIMVLSRTESIVTMIFNFILYSIIGLVIGILLCISPVRKLMNRRDKFTKHNI